MNGEPYTEVDYHTSLSKQVEGTESDIFFLIFSYIYFLKREVQTSI